MSSKGLSPVFVIVVIAVVLITIGAIYILKTTLLSDKLEGYTPEFGIGHFSKDGSPKDK